jgi:predicted O-methyltransferase YrrM
MAAGLLRLARRRDRSSRALARALKGTAFAGGPPEEQVWIDRLESYRRELGSREATAPPAFATGSGRLPDWAAEVDRPLLISETSRSMSIPPLECTFLMRLVRELKPGSCVELGTGFGVSTAYQAASLELNGTGRLITLDAATEWMKIAERGLSMLGLDGIVERRVGPIDGLISEVLPAAAPIDYALLDADHAEEATLRHFEAIFPHLAEGAVAVFDDINWTEEMQRAWARVGRHDGVSIGVDIGRLGVAVVAGRSKG